MTETLPDAAEVRRRLAAHRSARGFLLPHHGAMAAALPDLQDAYGPMYRALTLDRRHLADRDKEFVWLAILVACGEHVGTHHVDLFRRAGGTDAEAEAAFRLVAWAGGAGSLEFLAAHWQGLFPGVPASCAWRDGAAALLAGLGVPARRARLALAGALAARAGHWALGLEIEAAYAEGVPEPELAEALSLVIWPCGVNRFLEACGVWLEAMRSGRVAPVLAGFRAWAETPAQDGLAPERVARPPG